MARAAVLGLLLALNSNGPCAGLVEENILRCVPTVRIALQGCTLGPGQLAGYTELGSWMDANEQILVPIALHWSVDYRKDSYTVWCGSSF